MTKKLNIASITNELEESAFFPSHTNKSLSPTQQPITDIKPSEDSRQIEAIRPRIDSKQQASERAGARPDQLPTRKRIITRNSFEIYEDQMDSLRRISYHEKMNGKLGSMSRMVRKAIDRYLQEQTTGE